MKGGDDMSKLFIYVGYVENKRPKKVCCGNITLTESQASVAVALREKLLQAFPATNGEMDHAEFSIPRFRFLIFSIKMTICLWWEVTMGD